MSLGAISGQALDPADRYIASASGETYCASHHRSRAWFKDNTGTTKKFDYLNVVQVGTRKNGWDAKDTNADNAPKLELDPTEGNINCPST